MPLTPALIRWLRLVAGERGENEQRNAGEGIAQQGDQLGASAVAGGQAQVDDRHIDVQHMQGGDEVFAEGVAGDDAEAAVAVEVQGDAATDDLMVVQKRQAQPARCRMSIHAQGGDQRPMGVVIILASLSRRASDFRDFCDYS